METFGQDYNKRIIEEEQVLSSRSPKPVVNPFGSVVGDTRVVQHLGPSTVDNDNAFMKVYGKGKSISSMEKSEEVFLGENFDTRDYFDSALTAQYQIEEEMESPVVEVMPHNSEITSSDLLEGEPVQGLLDKIKSLDSDKVFKVGVAAVLTYLVITR